jgi:hypothetical protein
MNDAWFHLGDLVAVTDRAPVEHIGGPDDGDWLPLCQNGLRSSGMYVPWNVDGAVVAKVYVPSSDGDV